MLKHELQGISTNNATERRENLTQSWEHKMRFFDVIWRRHNKSKMADIPNWKSFLAISRRHIGRLMRNLERRWRITRITWPNGNFRKFKMADGRHFENSFISISQPWIIQFRSNLVCICKFPFRRDLTKIESLQIQDGVRTPYWKSFLAISWRCIGRLMRNLDRKWRITCRYRSRDQNGIFSKIQDGGRPPFWK